MVTYKDMDDAYHGRGRFEGDGRTTILADMAADARNRSRHYELLAKEERRAHNDEGSALWVDASHRHYADYRTLCTAVSVCVDPKHYSDCDDNVMRFVDWLAYKKNSEED